MTAPGNKRRIHNDAARDASRRKPDAAASRSRSTRKSRYGRRLAEARVPDAGGARPPAFKTPSHVAAPRMPQTTQAPSWEAKVEKVDAGFPLRRFRLLDMSDEELEACSKAMSIGLSRAEMKNARDYFAKRPDSAGGPHPTDVELEALGQAWSEHCCYKSSKPVLQRHVYGIHEDKILCREDAGIVPFGDGWAYAAKLESHNHPSAIEPYGGAATGIGGVLRDVVCMGAQPVALIDPLFFGPLDTPHEELPPGVKHPRFLLGGVVAGIRDYGNRVGIPTVAGGITFHPGYTQNCLVNVGCVGVLREDRIMHSRAGGVGDVFVYLGNPTGRDGIHGVAFASEELSEESEEASRSAVQVGDAILKEPLIHTTLEIIEAGLATGCKDFGGGGLSCVAGELAYDAGFGCHIELEKVPTKVPGMAPWEIWVSESQERMMVTARPENVPRILEIAAKWDVPARVVGSVQKGRVNHVTFHGTQVLHLDLSFSTGGPVYDRPMSSARGRDATPCAFDMPDVGETLLALLCDPNIMSKEWVIRQYDHEVRAGTVLKPLQGVLGMEGPGDAAVVKPVPESRKALALCSDVNPRYTERDPYWGSVAAMDEIVRNLACVGAWVSSVCDNLNFGNPERPERMAELEEATRGLGDMARALGVPFSSGNVSLYNEGPRGPIPPTPTLLGIGILDDFAHATTMDAKRDGNEVWLVGATGRDLGGSAYLGHMGLSGEAVPRSDVETLKKNARLVVDAIASGLVCAAHDPSEGGIAVALAEMAFAGSLGIEADLSEVPGSAERFDIKCFSESQSRFIVEVHADKAQAFAEAVQAAGVQATHIGHVRAARRLVLRDGDEEVRIPIDELREAWSQAMPHLMGVGPVEGAA